MIHKIKIKAGAVQYVLVVSVIILIVLFAFISMIFLYERVELKSDLFQTTNHNCYAGFDWLEQNELGYNEEKEVQFSEYVFEKTSILKKRWGIFDLAIVKSALKNEVSTKVGLLANEDRNRKALYLEEHNQPLKVVGNTQIIGDVVLPKRGVNTGNISGTSYYGSKLIYGNIQTNSGSLPRIKNIEYLKNIKEEILAGKAQSIQLEERQITHQSFTEETLVFWSSSTLSLEDMNLSGNIVLVSDKKIIVKASSKLNQVLLIAPEINIQSGFTGTVQAIAENKIVVSKDVKLLYPSVAIVLNPDPEDTSEKIIIEKGADVRGIILYNEDGKKGNYYTQVQIQKGATITGEVYCNKNLELLGTVNGFVYTGNFITRQSGGAFINYIYNGKIDATNINSKYAGLFVGETKNTVAKWVD